MFFFKRLRKRPTVEALLFLFALLIIFNALLFNVNHYLRFKKLKHVDFSVSRPGKFLDKNGKEGGSLDEEVEKSTSNKINEMHDLLTTTAAMKSTQNEFSIPLFTQAGGQFENTLFVYHVRLTTSYLPEVETVHVDVFLINQEMFTQRNGLRYFGGDSAGVNFTTSLLPFYPAQNLSMECLFEGHQQLGKTTPSNNNNNNNYNNDDEDYIKMDNVVIDHSAVASLWTWAVNIKRCDITKHINRSKLLSLGKENAKLELPIRFRSVKNKNKHVFRAFIPIDRLAVGMDAPRNVPALYTTLTEFAMKKKPRITLCVAGINIRAMRFIVEFIHHHVSLGVEHFVFGVFANMYNNTLAKEHVMEMERALKKYVDIGLVMFYPQQFPDDFKHVDTDLPKFFWYQTCLYYAKGVSEYVATWDIDEFWSPVGNLSGLDNGEKLLLNALTNYKPRSCKDWCYVTFPSYSLDEPTNRNQINNGIYTSVVSFDFTSRWRESNWIWKKSVARSKNAFLAGFHVPGSCLSNGKLPISHAEYRNPHSCGVAVTHVGVIHHYFAMFRKYIVNRTELESPDELSRFSLQRLVRLAKKFNGAFQESELVRHTSISHHVQNEDQALRFKEGVEKILLRDLDSQLGIPPTD